MKRRAFIKKTLASSVLALGGVSAFQFYQQSLLSYSESGTTDQAAFDYQFLTNDDRLLLEVLIPVMLVNLSTDPKSAESRQAIIQICHNIDQAVTQLALRTQQELRGLFDLLGSVFGRVVLAQVWLNWQLAGQQNVDQFLKEWRESSIDLLQIAYKGLHKLIIGSRYAEPSSWPSVGYPGPPQISFQADTALNSLDQSIIVNNQVAHGDLS